jgi:hypothetical protein
MRGRLLNLKGGARVACVAALVAVIVAIAVWTARHPPSAEPFQAAVNTGPDPVISMFGSGTTCSPACCASVASGGTCPAVPACSGYGCRGGCVCLSKRDQPLVAMAMRTR